MITNKYKTNTETLTTSISGGRLHHTYRQPVRAITNYTYELNYGENYHTLSALIFGTDEYYWALADMNKPKDVFSLVVGNKVVLPNNIVKDRNGVNKFV